MAVKLERDQIVRTALRLLNEVGLEGLTLRRIATELQVQAPALYWHFRNKQALLDEMATTIMRDHLQAGDLTPPGNQSSREILSRYAHTLRRMLLAYRDGARMFSGTAVTDASVFAGMEDNLRQMTGAGYSLEMAIIAGTTIYAFVIGFTIEEQAVFPLPGQRAEQYDLDARAKRIDRETYPLSHAAGHIVLGSFDMRFERGVDIIVTGLEASRTSG